MSSFSRFNPLNQQDNFGYKQPAPKPNTGLPRIIFYCADTGGCMWWRFGHLANYLTAYEKAICMTMHTMVRDEMFYRTVDAVVLQRQISEHQVNFILGLRRLSDKFKSEGEKGFRP